MLKYGIMEYLQSWMMMVLSFVLLFEINHLAKVNVWNLNVLVFCCLLYKGEYFYDREDSCLWCLVAS